MPETRRMNSGMYPSPEIEQDLQERLSRIEGHVRGVRKMISDHRECGDILVQIAGVKAAINQVGVLLLHSHLENCVTPGLQDGEAAEALDGFKDSLSLLLK